MTNLATNLFLAYMIYIISFYIKLAINKNKCKAYQDGRQQLDKLRKIPLKTIEDQKRFLDIKYPKTPPFVWNWKGVLLFILKLVVMVSIFIGARYLWKTYIIWEFSLWHVIIIMVVLPILLNMILKKYNLQQDDLLVFFR